MAKKARKKKATAITVALNSFNHGLWSIVYGLYYDFLSVFTFTCGHRISPSNLNFLIKFRSVCCEYCSCLKVRSPNTTSSIQKVDWNLEGSTYFSTKGMLAMLPPLLAVSTVMVVTL